MPKSLKWALCAAVIVAVIGQATGILAGNLGNIIGRVTTTSTISGHTTVLPLADVHVTAAAPSGTFRTATNAGGYYALAGLPPDTYVLTFARQGYVTRPVAGITVTQDNTTPLNVSLEAALTKLGTITVRGATSLIQTSQPADQYTVTPTQIQNITGTPQNISETAVLNSLPGITTDNGGYPIIRGGAENDEGFQLEGIDATEPVTGQFINSLSLAGTTRIVVSTGGYDVSNGNTNSGVVNIVIGRGSYPGAGQATFAVNAPNFDHRFAIQYGNGTPDNRFSYFYAFNGLRQYRVAGDQHTFLPREVGDVGDAAGNENVVNLFYRWGDDNRNELQYLGETGANLFDLNYNELQYGGLTSAVCNTLPPPLAAVGAQTCLPFGSANQAVWQTFALDFFGSFTPSVGEPLALATSLFPGQVAAYQAAGYPDNENNEHFIEKLGYKRQFSPSSYGEIKLFRTNIYDHFILPWDGGAFGDFWQGVEVNNLGVGFDYQNQFNNQHLFAIGGESIFTYTKSLFAFTAAEPFLEPNEFGYIGQLNIPGCQNLAAATTNYCTSPSFPLPTFVQSGSNVTHPVHRYDAWVEDTWTPSDHWNIKGGVRFDKEQLELPANAQALSTGLAFIPSTFSWIDVPAPPIGSNVTQPSQVSPRLALTYTPNLNARNVFRASAGTNIEWTPTANVENTYPIPQVAFNCTMASGCFFPLPGFSATCVNGVDPANSNALCNGVTNLGQQAMEDLNANDFQQYTPVLPQTAVNYDASWSHDWTGGLETRITGYYRRGFNYVVASTPLLGTTSTGDSIFGAPKEINAGINQNTGVELAIDKVATFGWSGFVHGTFDNTLANYNSDFFPSVNTAALALHHFFHVSYLAPVTATIGVTYHDRRGLWLNAEMPYTSGYYYGVGKKTFVNVTCNLVATCTNPNPLALVPVEVLNTNLAAAALGLNAFSSAYYFTDPTNPGTIVNPNIVASRGTTEGDDPGTIKGPQIFRLNMSIAHDIGNGPNHVQVGFRVTNLLGNYTNTDPSATSRFRPNGLGGFNGLGAPCFSSALCGNGSTVSGANNVNPTLQPLQFPRGPLPYDAEATGTARLFTFFVSSNF